MREKCKDIKNRILEFFKNGKKRPAILAATVALAFFAAFALAAFFGNGSTKGVLVESEFSFNSNVLTKISTTAMARSIIINTASNSQTILIRNYNLATGEIDHFDISYRLTCSLSNYDANDTYRYYIAYGANEWEITNTAVTLPCAPMAAGATLMLPASTKADAANTFTVIFRGTDPDENPLSGVVVTAEPLSPSFMKARILGGTITKSNTAFSVSGSFTELGTADNPDNFAGFIYQLLSSGIAEPGQRVRLSWDATKLEFDPGNAMLSENFVQGTETSGVRWDSITFTPSELNRYFTVAFYRAENDDFWDSATAADILQLVTYEVLNGQT